jgi:hypothetical protein
MARTNRFLSRSSRRQVLRGLGVTLTLPWLEGLAPRGAQAQPGVKRRWLVVFFPNGTAAYWSPTGEGRGDAWQLSPILEPLGSLKAKTTVLSNVENYSPFGSTTVEPSHSQLCGAFLTCTKCEKGDVAVNNVSADQIVAKAVGDQTPFASLQVGLSTRDSFPDGRHPANSRSISWGSPTEPLYKTVNPQALFDRLVASTTMAGQNKTDPMAERRRALRKSTLDYVLDDARAVHRKVGASDRQKLDQFLTSVQDLEKRVLVTGTQVAACMPGARPVAAYGVGQVPTGYDRNVHADVMIDLVVMALKCDLTRVVTFMLDDERSDFSYNFLPMRTFTATASTPGAGMVNAGYHDLQHSGDRNNGFATITRWNVEKLALLCGKLDAIQEGTRTLLDNSVVSFGSCMFGGNHKGWKIPTLYVGSGGGVLKTNEHVSFKDEQRLSELYLTYMQKVFGVNPGTFSNARAVVPQILV